MKSMKLTLAATAVAALFSLPAMAQVKIGVISSATGPTALVGIPQKNTVPLLPTKIGDLTVQYIAFDDGSDTTASVTDVKKLISEDHVDAIIGPTGTPNAMGVIQFVAEAGVPMLAPVGGADVVLPMTPQKKWVFKTTQNDDIIATALVDHMVKTGIKTLGLIGLSDPFGDRRAFGLQFAMRIIFVKRRAAGIAERDRHAFILLLQPHADAGKGAAGAHCAGEAIDPPVHLRPDFLGRALDMRAAVGDIVELIGPDRIFGFLGDPARGVHEMALARIRRCRHRHQLRAKRTQRIHFLS